MSFPFLDDFDVNNLGYEQKWAIIGDVIDYALAKEYTQTATKDTLRSYGFTFGNTPFSALWQNLSDFKQSYAYPTTLPRSVLPDIDRMATTPNISEGWFVYTGKIVSYDSDGEILEERYWRVKTSELLNATDASDAIFRHGSTQSPLTGDSLSNIDYVGAIRGIGQ